jgi:predicted PurR-regulated permease PerM
MSHPPERDWETRSHIRTVVLLSATAAGVYLCYRLAQPFLPPLTWAVALAVLFTPLQRWLEMKLRRPGLAAALSVMVIGLIVILPATFVARQLVIQTAMGVNFISSRLDTGEWRHALEAHTHLAPILAKVEAEIDLPGSMKSFAAWLSPAAGNLVRQSMGQMIAFCLVFYLLFFFLRDRHAALQTFKSASPLTEAEMNRLYARVGDTIHATVYGTLAVAAIQGLLGGLMFWALGIPAPLLWGVIMALLAVVPVLGAFVIWIPAAAFLALEGHWGKAIVLAAWGMLVIGTIDNLLRPILVGNRLRLHTVASFIAILGGLLLFGPSGLILGPVVTTVTMVLLELWPHRTAPEPGMAAKPDYIARFENEGGRIPPGV